MSVNLVSLGISAPSCKKWERKKSMESYVEFQKLKFSHTGKLETATMVIQLQKSGKTAIVKTVAGCFEVSAQNVMENMAEILEIGRSLPLMREIPQVTVEIKKHNLPDYGIREKTPEEKYAERLRQDRWDVRRFGDPSEWRLVRV